MTDNELFETHETILLYAASERGWRQMPPGGDAAIAAGLVLEAQPNWTYSDGYRASNGFSLTPAGDRLLRERGYICQCARCGQPNFAPVITIRKYCPGCQAGINKYGETQTPTGISCRFHARLN